MVFSGAPCDVSHSVCLVANLNKRLHIHEAGVQRAEGDMDLVKMRLDTICFLIFHVFIYKEIVKETKYSNFVIKTLCDVLKSS